MQARQTPRGRGGYRRLSDFQVKNTLRIARIKAITSFNTNARPNAVFTVEVELPWLWHCRFDFRVLALGISKSRSSGFPKERLTTDLNSTGRDRMRPVASQWRPALYGRSRWLSLLYSDAEIEGDFIEPLISHVESFHFRQGLRKKRPVTPPRTMALRPSSEALLDVFVVFGPEFKGG